MQRGEHPLIARIRLGRNDPCWCGSGAKYKYCHLNRGRDAPLSHQTIITDIQQATKSRGCFHPHASSSACGGKTIQSHSIPESALRQIAESGHLLSLQGGYDVFLKTEGDLRLKRVGIHSASAFPAFCELHDSSTFRPIEANSFIACPEHAFLSSYRALCRELFFFLARKQMPLAQLDRGLVPEGQRRIQALAAAQEAQDDLGLLSLQQLKSMYDAALVTHDFSTMSFYAVSFDKAPDIMMTSMFAPFVDFAGRRIRHEDVLGTTNDHCILSLFASATRGWFQIAWLGESQAGAAFAKSLADLPDNDVPDAVTRLVFTHFENTYFRPSWWASLPQEGREALRRRRWNPSNPFAPVPDDYLRPDGHTYVHWRPTARHSAITGDLPKNAPNRQRT